MTQAIFPPKIKNNAKIAVITPAGAIEKGQLDATLALIEAQGFRPVLGENVYAQYKKGYNYGGSPAERLQDLQWALDGDFGAIWTTRGGYGCIQLLKEISLKEFRKQPKYLIGYSDVTVLQSYLLNQGFASIHGQSIKTSSFGVAEESYQGILNILKGEKPNYEIPAWDYNRQGKAKGQLVGGNLAMLYSTLGSPFSFNFKDKILFIEEVGEDYYALDRMLMNLENNDVFKHINGLIVGGMTAMGDKDKNENYKNPFDPLAYQLIAEKTAHYDFPIAFGMPNGHIYNNQPLILGAEISLEVGKGSSRLNFV